MTISSITVKLSRLAAGPDEYASTRCPACEEALSFHQPDTRQPHRLLAICDTCDAWFLIDLDIAQILHLPDAEGPPDGGR
jgi:hypothetical protein